MEVRDGQVGMCKQLCHLVKLLVRSQLRCIKHIGMAESRLIIFFIVLIIDHFEGVVFNPSVPVLNDCESEIYKSPEKCLQH